MQPEAKLVKRIQRMLKDRGARVFKIHGGDNPFQEVGIPDLLVCYRGQFIGLEVKQPGEIASPKQLKVLHEIEDAGGIGEVVSTVGEVEGLLSKIDRERWK